jgi:hypothetical protein
MVRYFRFNREGFPNRVLDPRALGVEKRYSAVIE